MAAHGTQQETSLIRERRTNAQSGENRREEDVQNPILGRPVLDAIVDDTDDDDDDQENDEEHHNEVDDAVGCSKELPSKRRHTTGVSGTPAKVARTGVVQ